MSALAPTTANACAEPFVLPTEPAAIDAAIKEITAAFLHIMDFDELRIDDVTEPTGVLEKSRPHVENLSRIISIAIKNLPDNDGKNALMAEATKLSKDMDDLLSYFRKHLKA